MDKYTIGKQKSGYFCGGSNINFNIITDEDKMYSVITPKLRIALVSYISP